MRVRIFKPAKTAMQSGQGNTKDWVLESEPTPKVVDPLMGWTGARSTMEQVRLSFDTVDDAKAHAERKGWQYSVEQPKERPIRPKAYSDNFAFNRVGRWTH